MMYETSEEAGKKKYKTTYEEVRALILEGERVERERVERERVERVKRKERLGDKFGKAIVEFIYKLIYK